MEFKKYPSITNSYNQKFIDKIKEYGFDKEQYYVTEKVHGANFSIYYDGSRFRIASRTRFLADDANFGGCQNLLLWIENAVKDLWWALHAYIPVDEIIVFGELCGGRYPHNEVKFCQDAKKIQGHVWYHPKNMFYVFDIKINGKFLPKINFECACTYQSGFYLYAKSLFEGSLDDCLAFRNEYQTTIPSMLGLPEIENNICEGNVIKPVNPLFFPNGECVILKNKNEKFTEISRKKEPAKEKPELSKKVNELISILLNYVNEHRLNNVISKIGEVTIKDFGEIMQEFSADSLKDFISDNVCTGIHKGRIRDYLGYIAIVVDYHALDKEEQKYLRKSMNVKAASLVRDYFKIGTKCEDCIH